MCQLLTSNHHRSLASCYMYAFATTLYPSTKKSWASIGSICSDPHLPLHKGHSILSCKLFYLYFLLHMQRTLHPQLYKLFYLYFLLHKGHFTLSCISCSTYTSSYTKDTSPSVELHYLRLHPPEFKV